MSATALRFSATADDAVIELFSPILYNQMMLSVVLITVFAFIINLPFGYFRSRSRRYSFRWFLYIHLPVIFVILARLLSHTDYRFIPLFLAATVTGQLCGGKIQLS